MEGGFMADKLIAEYKSKEFERLRCYALNQMSTMEACLNPLSVSRGIQNGPIDIPSMNTIRTLFETLIQLRTNMLSPEERRLLNEKR